MNNSIPSFLIFATLIFFTSFQIKAQESSFKGSLKDAQTQEPIPFAHFKIKGTNSGFVTDLKGQFQYRSKEASLIVYATAIGYESKEIRLEPNKNTIIELTPNVQSFSEIVVTYVDKERELLHKVLDNIQHNYPQKDERLKGRIIEQLAQDSSYENLIYTATSSVEADKLSYEQKNVYGTVKIIDGEVEYFQSMDSTFIRIYAGIHNVHRFDIIAARMEPFDNIDNKNYTFQLVDTLAYEGQALFKVSFEAAKHKGFLYVQDSTFALVKGEYSIRPEKRNGLGLGRNRLFLNFTTEYFKQEEDFRISYINYQTGFSESKRLDSDRVYLNNFFYLNQAENSEKLIPFNQQTNFTDIFIDELPAQKISLADSSQQNNPKLKIREKGLVEMLKDVSLAYQFGLFHHQFSSVLPDDNAIVRNASFDQQEQIMMFHQSIGYSFSNSFQLVYLNGASFKRDAIRSHTLLARYLRPLNKNRRFLFGPHLGFNYLQTDLEAENNTVIIGGGLLEPPLSESEILLREETEQFNLLVGLQLKYRIGKRFFLTLSGDLPLSLSQEIDLSVVQDGNPIETFAASSKWEFQSSFYQPMLGIQMVF